MIKHVIIWQLRDGLTEQEKKDVKKQIKEGLEGLIGIVPGLLEVKVYTEPLKTSNADILLDSTVENEEALKVYAGHPEHVKIKDGIIAPNVKSRVCMDYEV